MQNSILNKRKRTSDTILTGLIYLCSGFAVLILLYIIGYVFVKGIGVVNKEFLTTGQSIKNNTNGILPNIINTLYIIVITLLISTPIGIGGAVYLNEYAKKGKLVNIIEATIEILGGIPSIIYGLFGMVFFGGVMKLSYSILTGSLTLAILVLPLIIRTTQEALKTVPASYREGAMGIGATKWYMIRTIILPSALPGIVTGIILSIGRMVGESAALIFTAGSGYLFPDGFFSHTLSSAASLTVQMYLDIDQGKNEHAFGIALVLIVIVLAINMLTKLISNRLKRE